jgi:hypothetical protein
LGGGFCPTEILKKNTLRTLLVNKIPGYIFIELALFWLFKEILVAHLGAHHAFWQSHALLQCDIPLSDSM